MKKLKFALICLSLVTLLSSCNFPGSSGLPTRKSAQNQVSTSVITQTGQIFISTPIMQSTSKPMAQFSTATVTVTPPPPLMPNTPVWSAYNYTCELATGGGTMTMNMTWSDRSTSEEGYIVYRDQKPIATLAPNTVSYVDTVFVATGKTLSYSVEAFSQDWRTTTSTITNGCQ